jgi:mono/diheme cytochrome c family protein
VFAGTVLIALAGLGVSMLDGGVAGRTAGGSDSGPALSAMIARPLAARDTLDPAMIALGDSIFHGKKAGGLCFTCHGKDAKGLAALGPNLTDSTWLHGDGKMAFLMKVVKDGVGKPKKSATVMPPYGGSPLNAQQLEAVASYVLSLS